MMTRDSWRIVAWFGAMFLGFWLLAIIEELGAGGSQRVSDAIWLGLGEAAGVTLLGGGIAFLILRRRVNRIKSRRQDEEP